MPAQVSVLFPVRNLIARGSIREPLCDASELMAPPGIVHSVLDCQHFFARLCLA
jgi:hypothetical protein